MGERAIPWWKHSRDKGFDFPKTWYTLWYLYTWDGVTKVPEGQPLLVKGKRGFDDARLNEYSRDELNTTLIELVNYQTKIGSNHEIKVLFGTEWRKGNVDYFNAYRRFFTSAAIDQLFAGGTAKINNSGSGYVNAG